MKEDEKELIQYILIESYYNYNDPEKSLEIPYKRLVYLLNKFFCRNWVTIGSFPHICWRDEYNTTLLDIDTWYMNNGVDLLK